MTIITKIQLHYMFIMTSIQQEITKLTLRLTRLRQWIKHYYRLQLQRSMDLNLCGSCSLGYHSRSDHGAVNGKGAKSQQGRENHHQDSGVPHIQHAIPQPPPEPCPTRQGRGPTLC
jgi:hypothetical protein